MAKSNWYELRFDYGGKPVIFSLKAKNYEDAVEKFTKKYGTWVGTEKVILGTYKIYKCEY